MNKRLTIYDETIKRMTESLFDHIKNLDREGFAVFLADLFPRCENCPIKDYCEGLCYYTWADALFLPYKNWVNIMNAYWSKEGEF